MQHAFGSLGTALFDRLQGIAEVCPDSGQESPSEALTASAWAERTLHFKASATQATVLDAADRFMILCCNRQWGKTTSLAIKALHRAIHLPNQSIVIISRTKLQAAILIERACNFALALGYKIRRALGQRFSLKLPNGNTIFAVPHNQDTSVGNTATVLIVDEAALVKDEVYTTVACCTSRTQGAIWLLSTPRRQAGFFYNIWHSKDARWRRIFATVKDCPQIDQEFLEMQRIGDPIRYRQDFLCEFIQAADRLISREAIDNMVDSTIPQWHIPPWKKHEIGAKNQFNLRPG